MSTAPRYWPYYCEENIWQLCADPRLAGSQLRVLFISNRARRVAMWGQRAAPSDLPIAWDYHVVLLARAPGQGWEVWDLDAAAPSPMPAARWLAQSFGAPGQLPERYAPHFRLVDAADYRRHFRSDRQHMRLSDGQFKQPPPPWPAILGEPVAGETGSNLARFIDVEDSSFLGERHDRASLSRWLAATS